MQLRLDDPSAKIKDLPHRSIGEGFGLLAGVQVLDLSTSIAGPYAGMLLGDMGADVIKIERTGVGDDARAWGPPFIDGDSLWYLSVNRNKRSVALDYSKPAARKAFEALVKSSAVVIVNQPAKVQEKLGIDAASCHAYRPDLIHVSITGFGLNGDRRDLPCYDLIAEGYSGVMDLTGEAEQPPQKIGAPAADMLAGEDAAFAAVSALYHHARTGEGHSIDISLVESMTRFLSCRIVPYIGSNEIPSRSGGKDSVIAIYQPFDTADLPINLALGNDAIWARFWKALGREDVGQQSRFSSNVARRSSRSEIVKLIQDILIGHPRRHWLALFRENRIPAGPINRIDEVVGDKELQNRGLFYRLQAEGRDIPQVGTGIQLDGKANVPRRCPPRLGASTVEVLREIANLDDDEIETFKRDGVI